LSYLLETEGLGLLYYPVLNADLAAVAEMIASPDVVIGLGDAGAHVALTMDAGQPTYVLSHWVRDEGLLPLEKAVAKLTSEGRRFWPQEPRGSPSRGVRGRECPVLG
jgi:N-acyl-D-aspartate/D-glutamate deacylase